MDDGSVIPRLLVNAGVGRLDALRGCIGRLLDAGADGLLVETDAAAPAAVEAVVREVVAAAGVAQIVLAGAPSVAGAVGAGLLLPERGMAAAEARRHLAGGALLGREVSSPTAAAVAGGVDFLVASWAGDDAAGAARETIQAAASPVLWRVADAPLAVAAIRAGGEGIVLPLANGIGGTVDALMRANAVLPPLPDARRVVLVNGEPIVFPPDTAITDLLLDLGLSPGSVQRNGVPVPRRQWDDALVAPGDTIETA